MKRVPKKNISSVLRDVRPPEGATLRPAPSALNVISKIAKKIHLTYAGAVNSQTRFAGVHDITSQVKSKKEAQRFLHYKKNTVALQKGLSYRAPNKFWKKVAIAVSFAVFILGVVYGVGILNFKRDSGASLRSIYADLQSSARSLKNFRPEAAKASLLQANSKLSGVTHGAYQYGLFQLSDILDSILPAFGAVPSALKNLGSFTNSLLEAAGALQELKSSGLSYFVSGDGDKFLALLRKLQKDSDDIALSSNNLINEVDTLKNLPLGKKFQNVNTESNLSMLTELYAAKDLLRSLIKLLEKPNGFHFALFFQNPSEMRPTGGFIGSYADLFIENGAIKNIDVRDIYDPDGQLDLKVVPPKVLQGLTVSWGARDANWFFDFPTTAAKVLGFLQVSKMYSEKNVTFEGSAALNTDLIEDMLGITGPIALPDYNLTLSQDNFLAEVQKEVETGTNKVLHQPKKILKDFTPLLLTSLKNLSDDQKEKLIQLIAAHVQKKDIQIYFRDKDLETLTQGFGLSGEVFNSPERFSGDYLAVVNANVAGGKSDVFINQTISLQSQIDSDGTVHNEVTVKRRHTGDTSEYSWYRAQNQDYMKIYGFTGAKLVSVTGNTEKTVYPRINYKHAGYATDSDVIASDSGTEFGKTFFDAWLTTDAGETKSIVFTYDNPEKIPLRGGSTYTFVFDRQSGVRGGVDFTFYAPGGFKWQESNKPSYEYKSDNPDTRITVVLTLQEI